MFSSSTAALTSRGASRCRPGPVYAQPSSSSSARGGGGRGGSRRGSSPESDEAVAFINEEYTTLTGKVKRRTVKVDRGPEAKKLLKQQLRDLRAKERHYPLGLTRGDWGRGLPPWHVQRSTTIAQLAEFNSLGAPLAVEHCKQEKVIMELELEPTGKGLFARGNVRTIPRLKCDRCGSYFSQTVLAPLSFWINLEAEGDEISDSKELAFASYMNAADAGDLAVESIIEQIPLKNTCGREECTPILEAAAAKAVPGAAGEAPKVGLGALGALAKLKEKL